MPDGPGAVPLAVGSIKATRIAQLGLCSTMFPMTSVVAPAVTGVGVGFIQNACDFNAGDHTAGGIDFGDFVPTLKATRYYMHGASFVRHEVGSPADQSGGFILNGRLDMDSDYLGGLLGNCDMVFNTHYQLGLADGILTIFPDSDSIFTTYSSSIMCDVVGTATRSDLLDPTNLDGIVATVFNEASGMQVWPQNDDGSISELNCDPTAADPTLPARTAFAAAVSGGAGSQGLTVNEALQLAQAANAIGGDGTTPDNWRCVPIDFGAHCDGSTLVAEQKRNRAQFIVRAKRINVFPDAVELVWFDSTTEYDNPTLALYYASFASLPGQSAPDPNAYKELCSRTPDLVTPTFPGDLSKNFFNRAFIVRSLSFSDTCPVTPPPASCVPCSPTGAGGFPVCLPGCQPTSCP